MTSQKEMQSILQVDKIPCIEGTRWVASMFDTTPTIMEVLEVLLLHGKDDYLRWLATFTSNIEVLERLSKSKEYSIRYRVYCNKNTPEAVIQKMKEVSEPLPF